MTVPLAVFASGSGSNMEAILDYEREQRRYRVSLVVTDRACPAEDKARARGVAVERIPFGTPFAIRAQINGAHPLDLEERIMKGFRQHRIEAVLLAGFLRKVPRLLCVAYRDRMLNIHPSLLPSFGGRGMYGRRVHEAVLESKTKVTGVTIHFVTERYDDGATVAQWPVPVLPDDSADTLAARVLKVEHALYPLAAEELARAVVDGWPDRGEPPRFHWPGTRERETADVRRAARAGWARLEP